MKKSFSYILLSFFMLFFVCGCIEHKPTDNSHPWGDDFPTDTATRKSGVISYDEIISNGEILVATLSGPETYYDYKGLTLGTQYLLLKMFTEEVGLRIRVEICKDTTDVLSKLKTGEVDIALLKLPAVKVGKDYLCCAKGNGTAGWYVNAQNKSLAEAIDKWYKPGMITKVQNSEDSLVSAQVEIKHTFSYFLNRSEGVISQYDSLFKMHSAEAGIDWRLLASMCYQESKFDYEAHSFAGACGLMQLIPSTAASLGLPESEILVPEKNISAAARLINKLKASFGDITDKEENLKFMLASYNGGSGHIRDAMALAKADGKNCHLWNNVAPYVLALSNPNVYNRPVVKHGYMRGTETVNYVSNVFSRWNDYRGVVGGPAIYNAGQLNIDGIVGQTTATTVNVPPPPGSEAPAETPTKEEQTAKPSVAPPIRENAADHSVPEPATTQRKAKYDVE